MVMFVLLLFVNNYDQEGGYFAGIFSTKELAEKSVDHIGRNNLEWDWYEIKEVVVDKAYKGDDFAKLMSL